MGHILTVLCWNLLIEAQGFLPEGWELRGFGEVVGGGERREDRGAS